MPGRTRPLCRMRCQSFRHRLGGLAPPRIRKRSQQFTSIDRVAFASIASGHGSAPMARRRAWCVCSDDVFAVQQESRDACSNESSCRVGASLTAAMPRQVCGNVYPRLVELKQTHQLQSIRWRQSAGEELGRRLPPRIGATRIPPLDRGCAQARSGRARESRSSCFCEGPRSRTDLAHDRSMRT